MSSSVQASSPSTSNFRPIFEKALNEYKEKTSEDLTAHPLTVEIEACDSPQAILAVLEGKANALNRSRGSDERFTKWLNVTVNIISALSATLGAGAGLVFPPTTIIFSGIGILLIAAKGAVGSRDMLVELFNRIESFFKRIKIYTEVSPTPALTDALAKIMAEVLSILAVATKGTKKGRWKIFLKQLAGRNDIQDALQGFGKLEQGELLTVIAQLSRDTTVLKDDVEATKADVKETRADVKETKADVEETNANVKETKATVKEIAKKMEAHDWEDVLQKLKGWLCPPDPSTNHNIGIRALRDSHEETATWFLEGPVFQDWNSTGSLLWIHGKPGSGKSTLCSAIIQHIVSLSDAGRALVAYFYFDFRDENKKHRHDLLPSLLFQLAVHSIPCCNIIFPVYLAHGKGTQQPSDDVLMHCLRHMISASTQDPMYIIMDALDECPDTSGARPPREHVLSLVKDLVDLRLRNLHICVTSRPEVDIRDRLEPSTSRFVSLHDLAGHGGDIAEYIRSEVDYIANSKRWPEGDKELAIETLSKKADGMFRWVFCQLEMLRRCLPSKIRQSLNELPESLDDTYKRILEEIPKTNREYAQRLLQCLAVAIRPLRVNELAKILAFDDAIVEEVPTPFYANFGSKPEDKEQELLSTCPGLFTIVDSNGARVVQFSHFSVKEFLTSGRLSTSSEDISCYHIYHEAAHTILARESLGVLLRLDDYYCLDWGTSMVKSQIPLAEYAANHWVSHAQFGTVSSRVMRTMEALFDSDKPHFAAWIQTYDIDRSSCHRYYHDSHTPELLYYSALCGFYDLVEYLLKKHSQHVNDFGGTHNYPLAAALHERHIRVAELLIQHGANVDVQGTEGQTPLHRVIEWPNNLAVDAVRFLLKHGAYANARRKDLWTPLHLAVARGYFEVVQILLQGRADVNSRNVGGDTPLHLVPKPTFPRSEGNGPNLVQLLLDYGAEVNSRDEEDATVLHDASLMRDLEVARVLVDRGANLNAKDNQGHTPLRRVFESMSYPDDSSFGIAQLLVERGADLNILDKNHNTPLHLASCRLDFKLVQKLLDYDANVNAEDDRERTPLHRVFQRHGYSDGRFRVAQLLVKRGAGVNLRDWDHNTPLHLASYHLDLESVRMLLDHGANVNATNKWDRTALHRVFDPHGFPDDRFSVGQLLAQLLVERGADVKTRDSGDDTPLHLASYHLALESVQMLLDHGANVNAKNHLGHTALHRVFDPEGYFDGHFTVAQLLVERGADVNAQDEEYNSPLHLASYHLDLESLRMLLDHGANVHAEKTWGQTPLYQVCSRSVSIHDERYLGVVQLLVESGADVNTKNKNDETPLHWASYHLDLELVRMLLELGANVNVKDNRDQTPLRQVFNSKSYPDEGSFGVAQLLVARGADMNIGDKDHKTPLHLASFHVDLKMVQLLLDHGADVNIKDKKGRTPLQIILLYYLDEGRSSVARLLVEHGADADTRDKESDHKTLLHLASERQDLELMRVLLDHGADINAKDNRGWTPLRRVVESKSYPNKGSFGVVRLLLERGADVDTRNKDYDTLLHLASDRLDLELVRVLLGHGADINAKDNRGWTPLCRVFESYYSPDSDGGGFNVARLLLESGADLGTRDKNHETPLHLASRLGSPEVVWILLKHGADINVENDQCKTPFQLAREGIREGLEEWPSADYSFRAECVVAMVLLSGY